MDKQHRWGLIGVEKRGSGQWLLATTGAVSASATGENDEAAIRAAATRAMSLQISS